VLSFIDALPSLYARLCPSMPGPARQACATPGLGRIVGP
jgi:hypothetical protein